MSLVHADVETCGGKAAALGALLREGIHVPDGFVVPVDVYRAAVLSLDLTSPGSRSASTHAVRHAIGVSVLPGALLGALAHGLDGLNDLPVAVRSSATTEDTPHRSGAGQHVSRLGVQGLSEVADAVRACWASLHAPGALAYRGVSENEPTDDAEMAVLVQRHIDADVSGVMFTPAVADGVTEIEASWGLGPSVVGGTVTPDAYRVAADGSVGRTISDKPTLLDRDGAGVTTRDVPGADRRRPTLDDATAAQLARLGHRVAAVLGGPQDVEWAIADGRLWVLQARPVTAAIPAPWPASLPRPPSMSQGTAEPTLTGSPGSRGTATGPARIVRGPDDFGRVRPGDILVCPWTDPAWTPLLRIVAGVVTETGGVLSHAAIVAREHHIPAVLGVERATTRLRDDATVTVDGTAGTVSAAAG